MRLWLAFISSFSISSKSIAGKLPGSCKETCLCHYNIFVTSYWRANHLVRALFQVFMHLL